VEFARKLTATPEGVGSCDIALLFSANVSEASILDGMLIVAGFNLINRVASALHFETPASGDFVLSAWFLRVFGYRFLCGSIRSKKNATMLGVRVGTDRTDRAKFVAATRKWFETLVGLDREALHRAPNAARKVIHKVEHAPASVTDDDVRHLKSDGGSEDDIFDLILSASAGAGLLRLEAGLRAMPQAPRNPVLVSGGSQSRIAVVEFEERNGVCRD
jgi:alkylhydroperoxidase family enzyme